MSTPQTIGPYRILKHLGSGGMSQVYEARRAGDTESFALKVLPESKVLKSPAFLGRFQREIGTMMSLEHPHIVHIREHGDADGHYYLVMELLRGESLKERLAKGPLTAAEIHRLIRESGEAMAYCHEKGIFHRDLKPTNIFIQADGSVKVLDFGLAKGQTDRPITTAGRRIGTPRYMAPECIRGATADQRSDVYQLGLVYYEGATTKPAFPEQDVATILRKVLTGSPIPLSVAASELPAGLATLIHNCLIKDPLLRYPDVRAMLADLDAVEVGREVTVRPPAAAP